METEIANTLHLQYALDTFYFLVCGALVMWMAAGFAMLEAGLVRAKNTTEILTKNVALFAIACLMFACVGYCIMYGQGGWFLIDISSEVDSSQIIEKMLDRDNEFTGSAIYSMASDFFFQVVFVATAMSIVSGAVAERMKLWTFLAFAIVMTGFIYPMEGRWTWGEQLVFGLYSLQELGFSDFAGSGIVHMAGAAAALSAVLLLGPRKGKYGKNGEVHAIPGCNLPLAALGTFILWLGWFGFNGGSVLKLGDINSANSVAMVFINTNAAAAAGAMSALLLARVMYGKADLTMLLNGALAGLVAITAEASTPAVWQSTLIGGVAGLLVVLSIVRLDKLKIDDPVGAISVHGVAGLFGLLVVPWTNSQVSLTGQLIGAITIFVWVFAASTLVWFVLKMMFGIRVSEEEEYEGMDWADCGMEAYPEFVSISK